MLLNLGQPVLDNDNANLESAEGTLGLTSPVGGFGQAGNININNDLVAAAWGGSDVTVTANSTDVLDPLGGNTSTKIVCGVTSAIAYDRDYTTPASHTITGTGTNGGRSFVLSFYARADQPTPMTCLIEAFFSGVGPDLTNQFFSPPMTVINQWRRFDFQVTFGASISTEIVIGLVQGLKLYGIGRTFYFWGVTFQEVNAAGLQPLITISSGTAVEYTVGLFVNPGMVFPPHNPLSIVATASALGFTTSYVDIPGAALTLTATGMWLIMASGGINADPTDTSLNVQLLANGSAQPGIIVESNTGAGIEARAAARQWTYAATAGHVVKLQGKKNSGGGGSGTANNWVLTAIQLS